MAGRQTTELIELHPQPSVCAALLGGITGPGTTGPGTTGPGTTGPGTTGLGNSGSLGINVDRLTRLVEIDPALMIRVLRHANSIQHGAPRRVASLPHALSLLGTDTVSSLAMAAAAGAMDAIGSPGPPGHWRHSLVTAACAGAIATELSISPAEAHTAGLLHDFGSLLLFGGWRIHACYLSHSKFTLFSGLLNSIIFLWSFFLLLINKKSETGSTIIML